MRSSLIRRQAVLAAIAVLSTVGAYGLAQRDAGGETEKETASIDGGPEVQEAAVGVYEGGRRDAGCGGPVGSTVVGVIHPVLPCGVKLVVSHGERSVRTEVVGRARVAAPHQFDLTAALATAIGIGPRGGTVRWRFAS